MQKASSARQAPNSSSFGIGRPRGPVSDDPAIELKRERQRAAALKYREKKKLGAGAGEGAGASSTSIYVNAKKRGRPPLNTKMGTGTASAMTTVVAPAIINPVKKSPVKRPVTRTESKRIKKEPLSIIGRAIKGNLARKELAELKQDKKIGVVDTKELTTIEIPYRDAKKYFSKDKAMLRYIYQMHKYNNRGEEPDDISTVTMEYKPYDEYDYFALPVVTPAPTEKDKDNEEFKLYRTKIPRMRDESYSDYLYNKFIYPNYVDRHNVSSGSGSIGSNVSANRSIMSNKSDEPYPISDWTSSSSNSSKIGTNSSNRYKSSSSSKSEYTQGSDGSDGEMVRRRAKFSSSSSSSIGKASSSSGSKVAGSKPL